MTTQQRAEPPSNDPESNSLPEKDAETISELRISEKLTPSELIICAEMAYADRRILTSWGLSIPSQEDFYVEDMGLPFEQEIQIVCERAASGLAIIFLTTVPHTLLLIPPPTDSLGFEPVWVFGAGTPHELLFFPPTGQLVSGLDLQLYLKTMLKFKDLCTIARKMLVAGQGTSSSLPYVKRALDLLIAKRPLAKAEFGMKFVLAQQKMQREMIRHTLADAGEVTMEKTGQAQPAPPLDPETFKASMTDALVQAFNTLGISKETLASMISPVNQVQNPEYLLQRNELTRMIGRGRKKRAQLVIPFHTSPGTTWEMVSIEFVTDEVIRISVGNMVEQQHFSDLGFIDRRTTAETPDRLWMAFQFLANNDGRIMWQQKTNQPGHNDSLKKNIQVLRQRLQAIFPDIPGDPFKSYRSEKAYATRFILMTTMRSSGIR